MAILDFENLCRNSEFCSILFNLQSLKERILSEFCSILFVTELLGSIYRRRLNTIRRWAQFILLRSRRPTLCCVALHAASLKWMKSNWRNVSLAILFDIAALNVSGIIDRSTKKLARRERLNYVTRFYSGSLKAAISGIARSAFCLFQWPPINRRWCHAVWK